MTTEPTLFAAGERQRKSDAIWEAMLREWYPTLDPRKIPETMRKELNGIHRRFAAYADCTPDEMRRRHAEAIRSLGGTQYATARKVATDWAAFAGARTTTIPNVADESESYRDFIERKKAEELATKQAEAEIAALRKKIEAAPDNVVDRLLAAWWKENPKLARFVRFPGHIACVRWIAERL